MIKPPVHALMETEIANLGVKIGQVTSAVRPISTYIGNPTIQVWPGPWTQLYVDYIRISRCLLWAPF